MSCWLKPVTWPSRVIVGGDTGHEHWQMWFTGDHRVSISSQTILFPGVFVYKQWVAMDSIFLIANHSWKDLRNSSRQPWDSGRKQIYFPWFLFSWCFSVYLPHLVSFLITIFLSFCFSLFFLFRPLSFSFPVLISLSLNHIFLHLIFHIQTFSPWNMHM